MKRRFTILTAALALFSFLAIPMGMRGQSDYSTDYTGNITLSTTGGSNASDCQVIIYGTSYAGIKAGTSSKAGAVMITVPAGTKYLHMHVAAWNNTTASLEVTPTGYSDNIDLTANSGIANNSPFTFNGDPSTSDYYKVVTFTNALTAETDLTFTAVGGKRFVIWGVSSEIEGAGPTVATPTFSPASGTYTQAQTVTISCATPDVDIYYTTDGTNPDDESNYYSSPITVNETTTLKAIAYNSNDETSVIATASYTILSPMTIAQVREQGTGSVLTTGTVTSCVGTTGYIQDATAAICVYGAQLTVGDNITVSGTLSEYNGLLEITNPQVTVISSGNTVNPEVMTIAQILASTNQGWYIRIEEATVTAISGSGNQQNTTIAQGDNTVVVRGNLGTTVAVNDIINLDGNIGCYNTVQIANPQNVTVQESNNPSIVADNVSIAYDATNGAIAYTINNPVSGGVLTAATTAEWLTIGTVGTTVPFTCTANSEVTARTATVTLTYTYSRATVTKEVTVTQAAFEAPHYTWDLTTDSYASESDTLVIWTSDYATMRVDKANAGTATNNYLGGNQTSTRFYKNSELTISPVEGYSITNVVFDATTTGYASALQASAWTNATATVNDKVVTVTPTDGTLDIFAVISGTCGFTAVTVYYVEDNTPSIIANNVEIGYNATSGTITYTINNPVAGGVLTAATTAEWLTLGTVGTTVPFTCTANNEAASRTATVTLTYTYNRTSVVKNVSVTQAGNPNAINNISDITEVGNEYAVRGTVVATNSRGFIIGDGTGYVYTYLNAAPSVAVNDMVTVSGTTGTYGHIIQFTQSATIAEATSSNYNGTPAATIITEVPDYTEGYHLSDYLEYEGMLTKSGNNYLITVGESQIQISYPTTDQGNTLTALNGKTVHVKGYFAGINNGGNFTTMLESVEEVEVQHEEYTLTISNLVNVNTYVFAGGNEAEMLIEGEGSAQIYDGTEVLISVDVEEGYALQSLMVDGVNVTSQIDETDAYTFIMPAHNVTVTATAVEIVAPTDGDFVRISSLDQLTDGCFVVIASRYNDTVVNDYFAMKNTISNGKAQGEAFVSITSNGNEILPANIIDEENDYYWVVNVTEDGYTFTNADGDVISYNSSTNFNMNGNNTTWSIERSTSGDALVPSYEGFVITNVNTNNRCIAFKGDTEVFGPYSTQNINNDQYNFFLDFFVQTDAAQTMTQTIALTNGANWCSTNVEITMDDLKAALAATGIATSNNPITINSKDNGLTTYNGTRWRGSLSTLDATQMYIITVPAACEITLEGMPIDPAEHPITIKPGVNWIAFPLAESMTPTNAFAGFNAATGDVVKSKNNGITTYNGSRWRGQLGTLVPGEGYMYNSTATVDKVLVFPSASKGNDKTPTKTPKAFEIQKANIIK